MYIWNLQNENWVIMIKLVIYYYLAEFIEVT